MTPLEQIATDVWRIGLPLDSAGREFVNAYAIGSGDGLVLIDAGWNTAGSIDALTGHLASIGAKISDVRQILVTHGHADHYGAAGRLGELGAGTVRLNEGDLELTRIFSDSELLTSTVGAWADRHGAPAAEREPLAGSVSGIAEHMAPAARRSALSAPGNIPTNAGDLEVIATPGHTDGHVVLLLREEGLLFSGDHILPDIYTNVSRQAYAHKDPLGTYFTSLRLLQETSVGRVLPGHGEPFDDLKGRVREILSHHDARLADVARVLGPAPLSAYEIASRCRWLGGSVGWSELPWKQRRNALFATLARAERLAGSGAAEEIEDDDRVRFRAAMA